MADYETILKLRNTAERLQLENCQLLYKYGIGELMVIYNGIGPDRFPGWLRDLITALHPSMEAAALIHDVEWHESDGSVAGFTASNERFRRNVAAIARSAYPWYRPRRWIVLNQARRYSNYCRWFGWQSWCTPCECPLCQEKRRQEEASCSGSC